MEITLDGHSLNTHTLWLAASTALDPKSPLRIRVAPEAEKRIRLAADYVQKIVNGSEPVYGINTGFGKFAEVSVDRSKLRDLQRNLIFSHAVGVGPLLPRDIVMAMWILRLNVMCRGQSGVRMETVEQVIRLLELGILADVPAQGSVGASGDLAPSAHATLPLLGEGGCSYPHVGSFLSTSSAAALDHFGLANWELEAKEGLSLINGTQLTTAYAAKAFVLSQRLLETANLSLALSIEALQGTHRLLDPRIFLTRNQPGATECADDTRSWLSGPSVMAAHHSDCDRVQDPYSLRCAPQVHGLVRDEIRQCGEIIERELNSSTDNPLLFAEDNESLSGGNFHAIYTARANDRLCAALTTLSSISERRTALLMSQKSNGLVPFLVKEGGFNSGLMMAQVSAAALVSESKSLCFPASVDSIPTSDDKEDHVSMGPIAGRKLMTVLENTQNVLAIEVLSSCQAIDLRRPLTSTASLERVFARVREDVPYLDKDRILHIDIRSLSQLIESGELLLLKNPPKE
jgi:histidine ammonia-lyase